MALPVSRSPMLYLNRKGLRPASGLGPRFTTDRLLIHRYETGSTECKAQLAEGDPPPDRAGIFPWPPLNTTTGNE
jgi:hypothetical protein